MFNWRKAKFFFKYCVFSAIVIILAVICGINTYAEDSKVNNILLINSYQKDLSWTDGIINTLRGFKDRLSISVEYMDWKGYPTQENLDHLYSYFKYKYSKKNINLIVATDDAALKFALDNRKELFSDAPVVFCGVNDDGISKLVNGAKAVIGIAEEVDPVGTIKAALKIDPDLKEVYVLYDNSESGISTGQLTIDAVHREAPGVNVIPMNKDSGDEILKKTAQISGTVIV